MSKSPLGGVSMLAALLVALAIGTLAWAVAMLPPDHPDQRSLLRYGALLAFAGVAVAAWGHGRAARARDAVGRWVALLAFALGGALMVFLYVAMSGNSHRLPRNESAAIGDIRALMSAQAAYSFSNGGFAEGSLECLTRPVDCLPGYPGDAPFFLDEELASLAERRGYRRAFHPGPAPEEIPSTSSPTSVTAWAYTAVPLDPGYTGVRGFCGDSRGFLGYTTDGTAPPRNADGHCDESRCMELN